MKNKNSCLSLCVIFVSLVVPFLAFSAPLDPAGTNIQQQIRQQERLKELRQQQEQKPDERNFDQRLEQQKPLAIDTIPENEQPCFNITKIALVGDGADQFQFALDQVLNRAAAKAKPILGRCLGVLGINAVMTQVQNVIIAQGFVTTRVLASPQDLKSGVLELTVVPGRVNAVRFTPDSSRRSSALNVVPMNKGDILNLRDIEQALENFKRVPTAEADIQIEPASNAEEGGADQPGLSDIVIRYQQRFPVRVSMSLDDAGANTTGKYQGGVTLSGDHLLSLNDLFYINRNHDLGGGERGKRGSDGYTIHYSMPWDYWLLSYTTSRNNYHQTVSGINQNFVFSGTSQDNEIKLNRLVYRNSINKTNLSLRGFLRKSNNYIDDIEIEVQRRRTAGWELGFNQSWYIGKAVLEYNLAYRRGTGAKESLKAPEDFFDEGTSRMALLLGDLNLTVPFSVNAPWKQAGQKQALQYNLQLRGQTNHTPLTPQDRFGIGNRYTVRGFDGQQTLVAERGWLMRNELSLPLGSSQQSIYFGLDYGEVGGKSSDLLIGKYLAGTVVGLRGGADGRFGRVSYDVFLGRPINKPKGFETNRIAAGFNVNYAF